MHFNFHKSYHIFILFFVLLGACQKPSDRKIFEQDLIFMHAEIIGNHPGIFNTLDPNFKSDLELHYQKALDRLQDASEDPAKILKDFANSFEDSHLWIENKHQNGSKPNISPQKTHLLYQQIAPDTAWITIPTFDLSDQQVQELDSILKILPTLQLQKAIIFDLRGNTGGNSHFGKRIIYSLFGQQYTDYKLSQSEKDQYIEWRASPGNLAHIQKICNYYAQQVGKNAMEVQMLTPIIKGMQETLQKGESVYRQDEKQAPIPFAKPAKVTAKIMVIIDKNCMSSSLEFIDFLKIVGASPILVGQTTRADRLYMEVRGVELPDGERVFWHPTKVYRNRFRGDNVPYKPDVSLDDISDTKKLQSFILEHALKA